MIRKSFVHLRMMEQLMSERTTSPSLIIPILIHEQLKVFPLPLPNSQATKERPNDVQEVSLSHASGLK